jgi:arylsulfatase A-like enzyme
VNRSSGDSRTSRRAWLRAAGALAGAVGASLPSGLAQAGRKPNIIFIVADDYGYADAGFQGLRDFETPHLDRLAASGVRFTNGYVTHPYCSPSRAAILTGRYQQRFGHEHNPPYKPGDDRIGTPVDEVLLPQTLREAGYRTAAIGKWHLGDAPRFLPHHRGFDEFFGFSGGGFNYYGVARGDPAPRLMRNDTTVPASAITYLTDDFTDDAVGFIHRNRQRPFFLYLAYNAVHAPDLAPQKYLDRASHIEYGQRSVYAAMTIALDDGIGRVIDSLEREGIREHTLVCFLSDNGGRRDIADNFPLRGHKGLLFEGGVRVPFVMSFPGRLPTGVRFDHPVSSLDLFPTAAALAGASTAQSKPLDGIDLMPYLTGHNRSAPHETLYWREIAGQGYAIRHGRYKLVKPAAFDREFLFDLENDPYERRDLAAVKPEVAAELRGLWARWNRSNIAPLWTDEHAENVRKERESVLGPRQRALPPRKPDQSNPR